MKKFYVVLALALFAFNAQAFDLTEAANKMADGINNTAEAIEEKKAERKAQEAAAAQAKAEREAEAAQAKENLKAGIEAKKAEAQAKIDAKKSEIQAKIDAQKEASEKAKAEREAQQAEQKKAIENAKDSLKNLKNAF